MDSLKSLKGVCSVVNRFSVIVEPKIIFKVLFVNLV